MQFHKCPCLSCAYYTDCAESFMLEHIYHEMDSRVQGQQEWEQITYTGLGIKLTIECPHYRYHSQEDLCTAVTKIGPHKYRFNFTMVTYPNKDQQACLTLRKILGREKCAKIQNSY